MQFQSAPAAGGDLYTWVLASAASALSAMFWDTLGPFQIEVTVLPHPGPTPPLRLFGFATPFCVPSSLTGVKRFVTAKARAKPPAPSWAEDATPTERNLA
jgi:hypothetical protein